MEGGGKNVHRRSSGRAARFTIPRLALWAGVGVFISALALSCGDDGGSSDLVLRVFYDGAGVADFDALSFERERYYDGIEADLCAFDEETGAIWVAKDYKVHKFDKYGRYVFGGVELRAKAADIVVNQKTHFAWVFREDGAVSRIHPKGAIHNRPEGTYYLPHPHKGNTEYFLEPDNNRGGCWIIAKNELYYEQEWGAILTHKIYNYPITAASASRGMCNCWLATKDERGSPELLYVDRYAKNLKEILEGVREVERLELAEQDNQLWMVDKVKRGGVEYRDLRIMNANGVLTATAPNVPPGAILAVDPGRGCGWYYGRTGTNAYLFAYDENAGDIYARLSLLKVGEIGTKVGNYTILNRGFIE
jgi:hypothetical protein